MSKTKAHIIYKYDGVRVPGVTTVIGLRAKPALVKWANNLGLQGIDSSKFTDDKAMIGTLAHEMILNHFKSVETDTSDYSKNQIDAAENSLLSFFAWEKGKQIAPVLMESPLTCPMMYGGTIDLYCQMDGQPTLVDFKTGNGIYDEHYYQLCAYRNLLLENEYDVKTAYILNIPRTEDESFHEKVYYDFDKGWEWFKAMLRIYQIESQIKKEAA